MSETKFKLSQVSNVMLGLRFTGKLRNVTGTRWAPNFDDRDCRHLSIFGQEHK